MDQLVEPLSDNLMKKLHRFIVIKLLVFIEMQVKLLKRLVFRSSQRPQEAV